MGFRLPNVRASVRNGALPTRRFQPFKRRNLSRIRPLATLRDSTVGRTVLGDEFCLVTIRGRVRTITAFGMFFDAHSRFFVPYSMLPRNRRFKRGEPVTLRLALGYARQEGLVG